MCYFTIQNLYSFIFCFLTFGIGAGIAYPVPFVSCLEWFKERRNSNNYDLIVLLHACFVCSPLLFAPLQFAVVNPDNIPIDPDFGFVAHPDVLQRVPIMFLYLAVIVAVLQIIGILFISNPSFDSNPLAMAHSHSITGTINEALPPHSCSCRAPPRYIGYHSIFAVNHKEDLTRYQMPRIEVHFEIGIDYVSRCQRISAFSECTYISECNMHRETAIDSECTMSFRSS